MIGCFFTSLCCWTLAWSRLRARLHRTVVQEKPASSSHTRHTQTKILNNYVSGAHSVSTAFLTHVYFHYAHRSPVLLTQIASLSCGYFLYDLYQIVALPTFSLRSNGPYVYHHVATLYLLIVMVLGTTSSLEQDFLAQLLHIGEVSNLFNYIVYHAIQTKYDSVKLNLLRWIQTLWFSTFRIGYFSYMLYQQLRVGPNAPLLTVPLFLRMNLLAIYGLGLVWIVGQVKHFSSR